ncbi:MAG TPA: CBS domain-containing protein [Anaerolineae bacterium]|nr:CBS domain-containing protein [Anaerolineae bacterium]HQI86530.1 CBS domain-containing protein [Anaerolineae bacterium]
MQVILTHENADFDAIASLLGAHKLYPHARPVLPHRVNANVQAFLTLYGAELSFVDPNTLPRGQHVRRVILVDTQSLTYVRGMSKDINDVLVIDHHTPPESLPVGWRFQGETLGATTTLLVEALSARLIPITRVEATLMLAGIYEDTGSLTYAGTSSRDLHAAAWLVDQGASLEIAAEFLEHPLTPTQQTIYDTLKENVETLQIDGHPVVLSWAQSPPNTDEEISTLAHKLRDLLDPSALFVLVEISGNTQLVARSDTDDINVANVAAHFGGGGHNRAAAALIRQRPAVEVFAELRDKLPDFVHPRIKVRDLMSLGVRTVRPFDPIDKVSQLMLRTGHEGFPVVDPQGKILGLVTRNAVDRAMQHQWDRQPVERIMRPGEVSVSPDDSTERVRTLMIHTGWGQIPVVENDQLIGVVTRTDMIRLPLSEANAEQQDIVQRMERYFPKPLLALIRQIGAQAARQGYNIYFVGGIVRDLLLGQPLVDVDIVVEGKAIELGRALAQHYGGEIHSHSRFGTVKWTLPPWEELVTSHQGLGISNRESGISNRESGIRDQESSIPNHQSPPPNHQLPAFIDLVTARTEFYEHPTALPLVERSSIKQDLHRRDFTINTLAIRLDPQRWGELLDFYGGKADLEDGVIRVLHSLSFIDDPTRILRAARFEARLGFHLDAQSEELIADALPLLGRITGGRIRHELDLIFREAEPEAALDRLHALGALAYIQPGLVSDTWLHERFTRLRQTTDLMMWNIDPTRGLEFLYWGLFLYRLNPESLESLVKRMLMRHQFSAGLRLLPNLRQAATQLESLEQPSRIVSLLEPLPDELLALAWVASDSDRVKANLERYAREWRHIQPALTGKDLKRLGLPPGPLYRQIFETLRAERLDGALATRAEEEQRVEKIIQSQ